MKCSVFFRLIAFDLLLASCATEDIFSSRTSFKQVDVLEIAVDSYSQFFGTPQRSTNKKIETGDVYVSVSRNNRATSADTLFYVVNFSDNQGFAIVSPLTADPLVGISDNGYFNPSVESDNPNFNYYVHSLRERLIESVGGSNRFPPADRFLYSYMDPKVHVRWGQRSPYGDYCPNGVAGCANTAIAMIMSYFKSPANIAMTTGDWDVHVVDLDWDELCLHVQSPNICIESDLDSTHETLAKLLRQVSFISQSNYVPGGGTGVFTTNALACMRYYGFACTDIIGWSTIDPTNYLDSNYLLYVRGTDVGVQVGHGWVVDGYKRYRYMSSGDSETYYHCNWGWDGADNGYFTDGVFNVANAYSYDYTYDGFIRQYSGSLSFFAVTKN